jgi:hypothetical protein
MKHELLVVFGWPNGIVVGNLIASAICLVVGVTHLDRLARRHHQEHMQSINGRENESGSAK